MLALFILAFSVLALLRYAFRPDPLRDIPGPWLARHTALLLAYYTRTGKRYLFVHHLHKKYGPLVRLSPTHVSCSTPSSPAVIYAHGAAALPKAPFYRAFYVGGTPSLFSTQDRAGHARRRRALAHPFSLACVRAYEAWVRRSLRILVRALDVQCVGGAHPGTGPGRGLRLGAETLGRAGGSQGANLVEERGFVDLLAWLNYMTFDVISDLAFGAPLGMLARGSDVLQDDESVDDSAINRDDDTIGIAALIDYRGRAAAFLGLFPVHPRIHALLHRYARWVPDTFVRRGVSGTETLSRIALRCVRRRLQSRSIMHASTGSDTSLPALDLSPGASTASNTDTETDVDVYSASIADDMEDSYDSRTGPDLLDRLLEGMRRSGREVREGGDVTKGWGGDGDGEVKEEDVVSEAMLLLTAGSDTTANSAAAVLFHVMHSPRVLHRLRAELEAVVDEDDDDDPDGLLQYDQIKSLKYLQATIDEGLRLFATNAFGLPRVVPEGTSVCVAGRVFEGGTELSAPAYTIQHDPAIWGDPEVFRPERWLEDPDDAAHSNVSKGERWDARWPPKGAELKKHLLTFGMGPRACIGKNLATMQMQLILATLVLRYDLESRDDVLESVEGFMHKPVAVWARLTRRGRGEARGRVQKGTNAAHGGSRLCASKGDE